MSNPLKTCFSFYNNNNKENVECRNFRFQMHYKYDLNFSSKFYGFKGIEILTLPRYIRFLFDEVYHMKIST